MSLRSTFDHVTKNWKTTTAGLLNAIIGFSAVASSPNPWISSAVGIKILGAASVARVVLGLIQTDGSKQIQTENK